MDSSDFDGSVILEKLALIGKVDDFFAAIDADDFSKAAALMKQAKIDSETIAIALEEMADANREN